MKLKLWAFSMYEPHVDWNTVGDQPSFGEGRNYSEDGQVRGRSIFSAT